MSNAFMFYRCGSCADEKVIPLHLERETIIGLDEFSQSTNIFPHFYSFPGRGDDTDYCILSPYVSRNHVQVWRCGDFWFIKDLGSVNGTYISSDDQVHSLDPHKPYQLIEGSVVALGVNPAVWVTKQSYMDDPGKLISGQRSNRSN